MTNATGALKLIVRLNCTKIYFKSTQTVWPTTVVATFALACSLPVERKVLCRLQINLLDQNNVYFGTPTQTLQTKKAGSFLISF